MSLCTRIDAIFRTILCNNDLSISKLFYSFQNFIFCHRSCVLTLIRPTEDFLCENDCSWRIFLEKLSFCFWSSLLGTAIDTFSRKQLCKNDTSWNFFSKIWVFFLSLWLLFAPIDTVLRKFSTVTDISIYNLFTKFMFLSFNIVAVYTQGNDLHNNFRLKRCFKIKHFCKIYLSNFDPCSSAMKLIQSPKKFLCKNNL